MNREQTDIQPLQNRILINYLTQRGIDLSIARRYLKEIYYTRNGRRYFALALPNNSNGYELHNAHFVGTYGKKDISLYYPTQADTETFAVTVFDGMIDFLSVLTYYRKTEAKTPVIVLNSITMKAKAVETIWQLGVNKVYLYLDRNEAGRKLIGYFREELPELEILDKSGLYDGYRDINEFLTQSTPP